MPGAQNHCAHHRSLLCAFSPQAVHKAVLTMDETGTEAAGATIVEMVPYSMPKTVKYNRPFMIIIYDSNLKTILFMGKVMNPAQA